MAPLYNFSCYKIYKVIIDRRQINYADVVPVLALLTRVI